MSDEVITRLRVTSDNLLPDEITKIVGIRPDKSVAKGMYHGGKTLPAKRTEWQIESGLDRSASLAQHVPVLLQKLGPMAESIKSLATSSNCDITFSCVVYSDKSPPLYFEPKWVSDIAKLGAALDIDLYVR